MSKRITVCIATHNRQDVVHQLLWSLRNQTYQEWDLCLVDDSDDKDFNQENWTKHSLYQKIINEIQFQGHRIRIIPGPHTFHVGHVYQVGWLNTREWKNPLFYRAEDDSWLAPDYFEKVAGLFNDPVVGAAAGLMLFAGSKPNTYEVDDERYKYGNIQNLADDNNVQWNLHKRTKPFPVEHINSAMMLTDAALDRIGGFEATLLNFHREDTHLSWRVHLEGMKVLIHPGAIAYHFRAGTGGARAVKDQSKWLDDLRRWSLVRKSLKPGIHVNLTHAIGDLILATPAFEQMRIKHQDRDLVVHHPYVEAAFLGNPNIDELAKGPFDAQRTCRIEKSIYSWMADNKWDGHIAEAYCHMLEVPTAPSTRPQLFGIVPMESSKPYAVITPQSNAKLYDFSDISRAKYWANDRWQGLINYLVEKGYDVIHLTGEEVHDEFDRVIRVRNLPFREAFRWVAGAKLLVGIDTMGNHVSAAFNIPTVTLFGRTRIDNYGHLGDDRVNFSNPCPEGFPCFGGQHYQQDRIQCPIEGHPCMDHSLHDVIASIEGLFSQEVSNAA